MDTLSFFQKVLPAGGLKILAELVAVPGRPKAGWRYQTFQSFEAMAEAVAQIDAKGQTVYHACNAFGDWYEENGKRRIRTQANVVACRSLYDDLDVAPDDPKKYASRKEALAHVKAFLAASGLPTPMIVASGGGLHLYWPLLEDTDTDEWTRLSALKRAAMDIFGLKYDPSCNMDTARVLRPVGSTWRKHGLERVVSTALDAEALGADALERQLVSYVEASGGDAAGIGLSARGASAVPSYLAALGASTDLAAKEYPPSSLLVASEHCNQLALMRDTQGDVDYEHWRGVIGLAKYATEGLELAEAWSARRAETGHSNVDVQVKFDTWSTGPATCAFFRSCNPTGCEGCTQKVTSPIMLGYTAEAAAPRIVIEQPQQELVPAMDGGDHDSPPTPVAAAPEVIEPEHWPEGYRVSHGRLTAFVQDPSDKGGAAGVWAAFAAPLFYPLARVREEDGTYSLRMKMLVKDGQRMREFHIPTKSVVDGKTLRMALGAYEITVFNDKLAVRYMSDYLTALRKATEEKFTFQQFGWRDDFTGFLIGDQLIAAGGSTTVGLSDSAMKDDKLRKAFDRKGTAQEWVDGVDFLYNRQHGEPYQYTICCNAFGAILAPLMGYDEWCGIPMALTSEKSGYGKSTVVRIGLNALCNANNTTVTDCTPYAVLKRASIHKNLPLLFDEVTNNVRQRNDTAGLSDVLYALSNGKGRVRLGSDGAEKKADLPWCLMATLTGNRNMMFNLTESKINPEAAQMRLFEVDLQGYPQLESMRDEHSPVHAEHQKVALELLNGQTSALAVPYITHVIQHRAQIQLALQQAASKIILGLGGAASKERFYAYHIACTLVGASVAKQLGYIKFDLAALKRWALGHIEALRKEAAKQVFSTEDQFSALLADLHGTILVTKHYDTLSSRDGRTELPINPVRSPISGRLVLGNSTERGKLFLSVRAIDDWCREKNVSAGQFRRKLLEAKLIRPTGEDGRLDRKVSLSRGVPAVPTGRTRCMEFEFTATQGYIDDYVPRETGHEPVPETEG